ncbi:S8 family serine peptidase [Falsiroseomonas tokyonensis]|uniref:S8 family serine peptidase n=1 Tax=Falsiroseomonas tokyonensis TaxID=430521 RepID=A0ABV7BN62_9PROT|nr:S8 family serine peptidase [Falsiroseomonas tokyonensis]
MSISRISLAEAGDVALPADEPAQGQVFQPALGLPGREAAPTELPSHATIPLAEAPEAPPAAPLPKAPAPAEELLVQFQPGLDPALVEQALARVAATPLEVIRGALPGQEAEGLLLRVALPEGAEEAEAIALLSVRPGVDFAEENFTVSVAAVSNDGSYTSGALWGMYGDATAQKNAFGSQAGEAWAAGATGSSKIVVGVIDSGINYTHADLYLNVWINQGEIPLSFRSRLADTDRDGQITFRDLNATTNAGFVSDLNRNGRIDAGDLLRDTRWANKDDQDRNGYRDDLFGWDFVNNDNDPFDDNGHGTHVSGTIGAIGGNGTGVAGVAWNVQILALKFLGANGSGSLGNAVKALDYYTAAGKATSVQDFVATNNSWGGGGYSSAMQAAIDRTAQAGNLFIAAAGNSASDTDRFGSYPANYSTLASAGYEAVVSVAALTSSGTLAGFSNYGATTVDLAAPGQGILSTTANGGYGTMSGTSMAAPHVTGAVALYAAANAGDSAADIRAALLGSATATASLAGRTATGGRLDAEAMLRAGDGDTTPTPPPATGGRLYGTAASETLTGTAGADILSGLPQSGSFLGKGTIDALRGLAGNDIFILGDARGLFYNDGLASQAGRADYGRILDFQRGDRIQLSDDVGAYFLRLETLAGAAGTAIYADTDANRRFTAADELVGHVVGTTTLGAADFLFA